MARTGFFETYLEKLIKEKMTQHHIEDRSFLYNKYLFVRNVKRKNLAGKIQIQPLLF